MTNYVGREGNVGNVRRLKREREGMGGEGNAIFNCCYTSWVSNVIKKMFCHMNLGLG